jgi:hypothetical protein
MFGGCAAELVRLHIGAIAQDSFCIEDEAPERIIAALRELGLDSHANINFPEGLKRALALKAFEETVELGVVQAARHIALTNSDPKAAFTRLLKLYDDQPKLGTRTATSVANQAYSTPAPLAYVASRLAGITDERSVYEISRILKASGRA